MKAFRYACLGALAAAASATITCAGPDPGAGLTPAEQMELSTLKAQLADPARTPKTKREAAMLLLTRTYPQAADVLRALLDDQTNRPAQIAVAEAIAQSGRTHEDFVKPLLAMLTGAEASVRAPAANALAAYKDRSVLDELIKLLGDPQSGLQTRVVIVSAMQRILDRKAVDALVSLLDDEDEPLRDAACDALVRLTNFRAFGRDRQRWKSWWAENKDKPQSDWLADLAERMARASMALERENADLRRRLADAMNKLYAASPPGRKDALLVEMLKDPTVEIRLEGARLTQQRITISAPLGEPLRAQIRAILTDDEPAVRRVAALLVANVDQPEAVGLLAGRLLDERSPEVREAIYRGLGLLQEPSVWDRLVAGVAETDRRVAAAAAAALAQVAEKNASNEPRRTQAAQALKARYATSAAADLAGLREALLGAMGALKDERLSPLMTAALKDPAATVRLSAVKGLQRLGLAGSAPALARLAADDPDRGVRLAAIVAVGSLGGPEQLEMILARTDARQEKDAAVRQQAWSVVMSLLAKVDTPRLAALADQLARRQDAGEHLISVLNLWLTRIPPEKADQWVPVRLRLGEALLAQDRPAEAAGELGKVHAALVKADKAKAEAIWLKWVEALLAADDVTATVRIAETKEDKQFAAAVSALQKRLDALKAQKGWDRLVRLARAAQERLATRLGEAQRRAIEQALQEALAQQRLADRQRVSELVARLTGADEPARQAAAKGLADMKARAVPHLVAELRRTVSAGKPDAAAEKAILDVLTALAPELKGYNPEAPQDDKIKTLDGWLKQLGP